MQEDKPAQEVALTQLQTNLQQESPPIKDQNTNSSSQSSPTIPSNPPFFHEHPQKTEQVLQNFSNKKALQRYDTIYLTGFNKFDTYEFNPTELAVNIIRNKNLPGVSCQVVKCSISQVDGYIDRTKKRLLQFQKKDQRILHLHLGVYYKAYQLEKQAENWKDFQIPDNQGKQPRGMKIVEGGPQLLKTEVDIDLLRDESDHLFDMEISQKAGYFMCNYLYYRSLYEISQDPVGNSSMQEISQNLIGKNDSLFVHFPFRDHEDKDLEQRDVKCIENLIRNLQRPQGNLREKETTEQTEKTIQDIVFIQQSAIIHQKTNAVIWQQVLQPTRVIETIIKQPVIQKEVIVQTWKEEEHGNLNEQIGHENIIQVVPVQVEKTNIGSTGGPQKKEATLEQHPLEYDHVFLTGFNTFKGFTFNPTEDVVKRIIFKKLPRVTCKVVDCSMRQTNDYVQKMKELMEKEEYKEKAVLHLHMGVGGINYELERYSRNVTEFKGVQDNDKIVLNKGVILEGGPSKFETRVKILELKDSLKGRMNRFLDAQVPTVEVKISEDAEGFICNYIYYKSCLQLQKASPVNHHSLFMHVPNREIWEHGLAEMDLKCVENILDILLKRNNLRNEQ